MKLLAVLLVLLVLLFVVAIGVGVAQDDQGEGNPSKDPFAGSLRELLLSHITRIEAGELTDEDCVGPDGISLTFGSCTVRVPGGGPPVRALVLEMLAGEADLTVIQTDRIPVTVTRSVEDEARARFELSRDPATLIVSCTGAPCAIEVIAAQR